MIAVLSWKFVSHSFLLYLLFTYFQRDTYQKEDSSLAGCLLLETAPLSYSCFLSFLPSFPSGYLDFLDALIFFLQ